MKSKIILPLLIATILLVATGCFLKTKEYTLLGKTLANNPKYDFIESKIYYEGLEIGDCISEGQLVTLNFRKDFYVSKQDSLFIKKNPLGTVYIDIQETEVKNSNVETFNSGDTVNIYVKSNSITIDSVKLKKIINELNSTIKNMDTILRE